MAGDRRTVLSELKTLLGTISEVTTVTRSYMDVDKTLKTESELPLINIVEPDESVDEDAVGMRAMMLLTVNLKVYFASWTETPSTTYETLMKVIRNKIGNNPTLNDSAEICLVDSVSPIEGEVPVYQFNVGLRVKYYLNRQST